MTKEFPSNEQDIDQDEKTALPLLTQLMQEKLGEIGVADYVNLPRKTKKAAKKYDEGQKLTQLELSRLNSLRDRPNQNS